MIPIRVKLGFTRVIFQRSLMVYEESKTYHRVPQGFNVSVYNIPNSSGDKR
jgi:hypothetical protein